MIFLFSLFLSQAWADPSDAVTLGLDTRFGLTDVAKTGPTSEFVHLVPEALLDVAPTLSVRLMPRMTYFKSGAQETSVFTFENLYLEKKEDDWSFRFGLQTHVVSENLFADLSDEPEHPRHLAATSEFSRLEYPLEFFVSQGLKSTHDLDGSSPNSLYEAKISDPRNHIGLTLLAAKSLTNEPMVDLWHLIITYKDHKAPSDFDLTLIQQQGKQGDPSRPVNSSLLNVKALYSPSSWPRKLGVGMIFASDTFVPVDENPRAVSEGALFSASNLSQARVFVLQKLAQGHEVSIEVRTNYENSIFGNRLTTSEKNQAHIGEEGILGWNFLDDPYRASVSLWCFQPTAQALQQTASGIHFIGEVKF